MKFLVVLDRTYIVLWIFLFLNCTIGENTPDGPVEETHIDTIPVVTTRQATDITYHSAKAGGEILIDLRNEVTDRGVCWGASENPTIDDKRTFNGTGSGVFESQLDSLQTGTKYYIRAFATNTIGTGYGENVSFTTSSEVNIGEITDIDGNRYKTIKIGDQWWMAENLKTSHYRNGDPIPVISDNTDWTGQSEGACCVYANDSTNLDLYGLLYNWYAATDERSIAPAGWHLPTDEDWKTLEMYLGMEPIIADYENWRGDHQEGAQLKIHNSELWYGNNPYTGVDRGFEALPGGYRKADTGEFVKMRYYGIFWTTTENDDQMAYNRSLYNETPKIGRFLRNKKEGYSIRCIKNP